MKSFVFLGDSLKRLREFPGYQLDRVQRGLQPTDSKPVPSVGVGIQEIRIWDRSGTYRVIYTARLADAVHVLHAFEKKTQATSKHDLDLAKQRFQELRNKK